MDQTDVNDSNGVNLNTKGRDEVDLMKLEIIPDNKFVFPCKVKLTTTGDIAFYSDSKKLNKLSNLEFDVIDQTGNSIPTTLFIEAKSASNSMRDIEIIAEVEGVEMDKVRATAIWVDIKPSYSNSTSKATTPTPTSIGINNPDMVKTINDNLISFGGGTRAKDLTRYGFGNFAEYTYSPYYANKDIRVGGRILFEFEIKPNAIVAELSKFGIKFDVARRKKKNNYIYENEFFVPTNNVTPFPLKNEMSNDDDVSNIDEDNTPSSTSVFSTDAPSINIKTMHETVNSQEVPMTIFPVVIKNVEFEEFVRVSFNNGNMLEGNKVSGSRVSDKKNWSINAASYAESNTNSLDPYNPFYLQGQLVPVGGSIVTHPRYNTNFQLFGGDGAINIIKIPSNECYALIFDGTIFKLYKKAHNDLGWDFVINSTAQNTNGIWEIANPAATIKIMIGPTYNQPFMLNDSYTFWALDIPNSVENKIKY